MSTAAAHLQERYNHLGSLRIARYHSESGSPGGARLSLCRKKKKTRSCATLTAAQHHNSTTSNVNERVSVINLFLCCAKLLCRQTLCRVSNNKKYPQFCFGVWGPSFLLVPARGPLAFGVNRSKAVLACLLGSRCCGAAVWQPPLSHSQSQISFSPIRGLTASLLSQGSFIISFA